MVEDFIPPNIVAKVLSMLCTSCKTFEEPHRMQQGQRSESYDIRQHRWNEFTKGWWLQKYIPTVGYRLSVNMERPTTQFITVDTEVPSDNIYTDLGWMVN